jgi:Tfp pilus assembly protein PilP
VLSCLLLCGSCEQNKTPKLNSWTTTLKSKQTLESIFIKALKVFDKFRNFSFHYISLNSIAISSCSRTNFV